jgi:pantothenate kinase
VGGPDAAAGVVTFEELLARAVGLAHRPGRAMLGICGAPGAGKSTLAERLVAAIGPSSVYIGMDGFHFAQVELNRLGRADRKGAPDTFDAAGYVALLRRLRDQPPDETVYAPMFRRDLEEPIGSAVPVTPDVRLIVTEGNYLLLDDPPWHQVRTLLDETWFLAPDEPLRHRWLTARHESYGRTPTEAAARTHGSDEQNARTVNATRPQATLTLPWPP